MEEIEEGMKRIYLKYKDLEFPVNWYEDQPQEDVREAILMACDAIIDSGLDLVVSSAICLTIFDRNPIKKKTYRSQVLMGKQLISGRKSYLTSKEWERNTPCTLLKS